MRRLLASLFRFITNVRNALYDRNVFHIYRSPLHVICVGNVVVGGNGKTPLVAALAELLLERGKLPVMLSRGYGGKIKGPHVVSRESSARDVGDEPLLLARKGHCPVVIARDRVAGVKFIEAQGLGDVVILDDGYQHRRLHRNLNILCFDLRSEEVRLSLAEDRQLPYGLLRESLQSALSRADLVVGNHRGPKLSQQSVSSFCTLLNRQELDGEMWIGDSEVSHALTDDELSPEESPEVVVVSGIARPSGIRDVLESKGFSVVHHEKLPDHSSFSIAQLKSLQERFPSIPLVCTDKDITRVEGDELLELLYVISPSYELLSQAVLSALDREASWSSQGVQATHG